jgi:YbbR domain-containing protein
MEPTATPSTLSVRGPSSTLDTIQSVRLDVALVGVYTDYFATGTPVIYDINGNDITESLEIIGDDSVGVSIPINKHAMIPVALPVITGYTLEGYTITDVISDIESVDVVGKDGEISAVTEIVLEPIDVTGASHTLTFTKDVRDFLNGTQLSIRNGTPFEVNITVVIEPEVTRDFSVPLTNIDVMGNRPEAEIADDLVISLTGAEDIINSLQDGSVRGSIDLSGLEPGQHDVLVTFSLPTGVTLTGEPPTIRVTIPEETEEEEGDTGNDEADTVNDPGIVDDDETTGV